jgi:hypothetical protein
MIVELLHQIMAEEADPQAAPEAFHLPEPVHAAFREKVFLYREANVLLALIIRAKQDALFEQPLQEYERILFPQSPETPVGAARLQTVKAAMQDLRALVDPHNSNGVTWGRNWFATICHDETNPMTLLLLFTFWSDRHLAAHKGLEGMVV